MQLITFRDVFFKGKSLCDCLIDKDMNLEEVLIIYCKELTKIKKEISLKQVMIGKLGIKDTCKLTYENLLTEILNALIVQNVSFAHLFQTIQTQINNILITIGNLADEKVKASATDTAAGYLAGKILTAQPGSIKYEADKLTFIGFVPIGTVMFINKNRLLDFDGTGKGRANTDLWGWAIGNGQNGTTNRLGVFPRYTDDVNNAGNRAGSDTITLVAANIPGFTMSVTGTISDALSATAQFSYRFNKATAANGGGITVNRFTDGQSGSELGKTLPQDIKHTHNHNLTATRTQVAQAISLLPAYIKEIPIERIAV